MIKSQLADKNKMISDIRDDAKGNAIQNIKLNKVVT